MVSAKHMVAVLKFIWSHPLNRGHRLAAIANFFAWQVGSRLTGGQVVVPWVDDAKFVAGTGETGLTGNLYAGLMEYEDMGFLLHALRPTDRFIDVGANVGAYTILASKVINAESVAFEPIPSTAERLTDQVHINRVQGSVRVRNAGVASREGTLRFTFNSGATNKVSFEGDPGPTIAVPVTTLDREVAADQLIFMKVDVEGFEFSVLEGAAAILASDALIALIVELNGRGEEFGHTNEEVHQKLLANGLVPVRYEPRTRKVTVLASYNRNDANTIYIRDVEMIRERCRMAPARVIHTAHGTRL